jgi:tetratricopeptide (TPR) repeat protein
MQAARLLQRAGRQGEALEYFRKVLALNPQNVDAAREVRLAQMREEKKAAAPAGLFGRLFRKKDG